MQHNRIWTLGVVFASLAIGQTAWAECTEDTDCEAGFTCELVGASACPGAPPCPEGEECPEPEPCESEEEYACLEAPVLCESDADCGESEACAEYPSFDCGTSPTPDCAPGEECPEPPPEEDCVETSEAYCVPAFLAPCEADADCGAGFTCVQGEICSCSGGGGSGGVPEPLPVPEEGGGQKDGEDDCICEPSGDFYCELIPVPCETAADCEAGFECLSYGSSDVPCTSTPDGGTDCPEPTASESYCVPPEYGDYLENVADDSGAPVSGTPESEESPRGDGDAEGAPTDGATGGNGADTSTDEETGCSAGGAGGSSTLWGVMLGLAVFFRRRRAA
jgi:MYXO-CTERM domain-containing protein